MNWRQAGKTGARLAKKGAVWTGKFLLLTAVNGFKAGLTGDIRKMKPVMPKTGGKKNKKK